MIFVNRPISLGLFLAALALLLLVLLPSFRRTSGGAGESEARGSLAGVLPDPGGCGARTQLTVSGAGGQSRRRAPTQVEGRGHARRHIDAGAEGKARIAFYAADHGIKLLVLQCPCCVARRSRVLAIFLRQVSEGPSSRCAATLAEHRRLHCEPPHRRAPNPAI